MPTYKKKSKNGSASKESKKCGSEQQNQRSISSFFQAATAKPAKGCLFTEVGKSAGSEVGKSAGSKLTLNKTTSTRTKYREIEPLKSGANSTDVIVIDNENENKPEKRQSVKLKGKENGSKPDKHKLLNHIENNNSDFTVVKASSLPDSGVSGNHQDVVMVENEVYVIPETQVSMATKTPKIKNNQDEEELIPDTPQSDKKDEPVKKRIFGRSFLTVNSNLGQNPYVLKREKIDKKQISKARKGLISVSVKFNSSEDQKDDQKSKTDLSPPQTLHNSHVEVSEDEQPLPNVIKSACDLNTSVQDDEHLCISDAETPTKVYQGERTSLKRMSKCGISPASKRCVDFDPCVENRCKSSTDFEELMEGDGSMESKVLNNEVNESKKERDDEISPLRCTKDNNPISKKIVTHDTCIPKDPTPCHPINSSKSLLLKTESSISYQLSMGRKKKDKKIAKADDSCLGEILDELDTHSKVESSNVNSFQPSVISFKKNRKSLQNRLSSAEKQSNLSKSFNESLTEDDLKYLDDLDEKVHQNVGASLIESTNSCCSPVTENSFQKPSFVTKKGMLIKKKHYTAKNKTPNNEENDDIVPTQTIVEFLSQMGKENVDNDEKDMDIAEFQTQAECQMLCNELDMLSPFETQNNASDDLQPACVKFGRHKVNRIEHRKNGHELCLHLTDTVTGLQKTCILSGFWADTHVLDNDLVHIIGQFDGDTCHISDNEGLIVVNPDILLSGTTVVSSVFCMRKGVLNEKFKGCDGGNIQMLYGSIIHSVFQQVLQKSLTTEDQILHEAEETVKQARFLHDMYKGNSTEGEVLEEIKKYIPQIRKWLEQYTNLVKKSANNSKKEDINITKVTDIEENIWSPRFGVKGKIDLTVEVQIKNKGRFERSVLPLELKTGRATFSMEHKGQVTLYSMMSSDRRDDPGQGLLLYLREPDMKVIPANHQNIRGLVQLRNEMAYYLSRQVSMTTTEEGETSYHLGRLPDPISNQRACTKCAQLTNCCIYQKSVEQRSLNSSMSSLVPGTLGHLSQEHLDFYVHWCLLLDLEAKANTDKGGISDLWCKTGHQREQDGNCISGLVLSQHVTDIGFSVLTFTRHKDIHRATSVNMIGVAVNDYMIISTETTNHLALCNGTVVNITEDSVLVAVESESLQRLLNLQGEIFRLDRYSSFSTANILYTNMSKLMLDQPRSEKLRKLVIAKQSPEYIIKLSKTEIEKVKGIFKPLNKPQKTAVLKVLMSKDYVLIKGYPGTGKTATIVSIVHVLNLLGLSVLLTSYTHSAVDNILLKLIKHDIKFVRLGKTSKIHGQIQKYSADVLTQNIQSVGELRQFYSQQNVVATSCLGINHPVFTQKRFDVCIVDEASQVLLPACLGPLFCADRFVLVGDPKQLPPVVQSREARGLGMDQSLFALLDGGGGTYELNLQYRMNRHIMALSNLLVYDGVLQCGSDTVANGRLKLNVSPSTNRWIQQVFDEDPYKAAVFVDTSKVPATESKNNCGMVINIGESKIVQQLVHTCVEGGVSQEDIGVIAPYRHQVRYIHDSLTDLAVEVNTVDQFQGRDKDVIIISFTRSFMEKSSEQNKSGELLKDVRRLNVAVSRAKKKLIMVGDQETLKMYQPLSVILKMMTDNNLIISLPHGAVDST